MKGYLSSAVLVIPLLLSGCVHKTNQAQVQPPLAPPIEDAPLPKPDTAPANLPPPVISLPDKNPPPPAQTTTTPPPAPQPPKKKKTKPTPPPTQAPAQPAQSTEQASTSAPEVPATGNFSSGDSTNLKDETQNMINDTDHALSGINRKLNDQETKTYGQIKEFLKQARAAMATNDMFGAHNLAVKAHVLLVELTQ
jgi:outer membrane biosynthesis protein TonB